MCASRYCRQERFRPRARYRFPTPPKFGYPAVSMVSPERRAQLSQAGKSAWNDPQKRARILAGQRAAMASAEVRARVSAGVAKSWLDPDVRRRREEANRRTAADPELRKRRNATLRKTLATPEARAVKSAAAKKFWAELKLRAGVLRVCEAHLARRGERVPGLHFVGSAFCESCFRGDPLPLRGPRPPAQKRA